MTRYTAREREVVELECANKACARKFKPHGQHKHAAKRYCSNRCRLACQAVDGFPVVVIERNSPKRRFAS